jgi:hypothetical protein
MFLRVIEFLMAHDTLKNIPVVAAALLVLQTEAPKIAALSAEKVSATGDAKDKTIHRGDLRDALDDAMQDISDMWKPMAKHYENAENKFRIPRGSDQLMISYARSFAVEAEPIKAAFIGRGMNADFIADLIAKSDAFADAIQISETAKGERVGVNAGFKTPVQKCKEAVEDITPVVKMHFRTDASKLAEWLTASHVERA